MKKTSRTPPTPRPAPKALKVIVRILDAKKAEDLRILDVRAQSSITDYLVLATGSSGPHLRALRSELEKALGDAQVSIVGAESTEGSGWMVFDAFDVMVHLFTAGTREKYGLELLWKDGVIVDPNSLLADQAAGPAARRKRSVVKLGGRHRSPGV